MSILRYDVLVFNLYNFRYVICPSISTIYSYIKKTMRELKKIMNLRYWKIKNNTTTDILWIFCHYFYGNFRKFPRYFVNYYYTFYEIDISVKIWYLWKFRGYFMEKIRHLCFHITTFKIQKFPRKYQWKCWFFNPCVNFRFDLTPASFMLLLCHY